MTDAIVDVIENPYHHAEIKPHRLDLADARLAFQPVVPLA